MQVNKLQFSTLNSNFITFFISDIKFYNIAKLKTSNTNSYFIQKDQKNTFSCFSTEVNKKFSSIQSKNNILFKNLKFFYNLIIQTKISRENFNPIKKSLILHNISQNKKNKFYNNFYN